MSLPYATTTVRIIRPHAADEPYVEAGASSVIASGVRAHISSGPGRESPEGQQEIGLFRMSADPVDLDHLDRVEDEGTGEVYEVQQVHQRRGLGLDHTFARLRQVAGVVTELRQPR